MDMRLELVPIPVSDVDRSKAFYVDIIGFALDHDVRPGNGMRIVQLTPPGSACSIAFGTGMGSGTPEEGTVRGLHLVVDDIAAARRQLQARGAEIGEIRDMGGVKFAFFSDPDGNTWELQELGARVAAREPGNEGSVRGTATSADGTEIVFERFGAGSPVIVVGGALMSRTSPLETVRLLAEKHTVYTYDRRGRGESGDRAPYSPDREYEDVSAILDETGPARVFGMSSGGFIALGTAARDPRILRVAVYEPPYLTEDGPLSTADYQAQLDEAIASGHPDQAVELFLRQVSGGWFDESIKATPWWPGMVALGPSLRYDAALTGDGSVPTKVLSNITAPVLALYGGASDDWAEAAALAVSTAVAHGQIQRLDGQNHQVDQAVLAAALGEFFSQ